MVEVNDVTGLCNTVYSFFLRQIYWHILVKMELWSSIVVSPFIPRCASETKGARRGYIA